MQLKANKLYASPNIAASQNYIPQSEGRILQEITTSNRLSTTTANNVILNNLLNQQNGVTCPSVAAPSNMIAASGISEQQMVAPGDVQNTNGK